MNEAETRAELIDPALKATGWGRWNPDLLDEWRRYDQGRKQSTLYL